MTDMLQKTENVANNVVNENSQDLTEQWKKGELPSGWYYLKVNEELANDPVISECVDDYNLGLPISYFYDFDVAKIEQVLAPVPSYEEWQALDESDKRNAQSSIRFSIEAAILRELLKECKQWFDWYHIDTGTGKEYIESWHKKGHEIHKQLNEALK